MSSARQNRKTYTVERKSKGDDGTCDYSHLTPAQRILEVWPLTRTAWAFAGENVAESRLQRHLVKFYRRES
jgi:hypothetical protein